MINPNFIFFKWGLKRKHPPAKCVIRATEICQMKIRLVYDRIPRVVKIQLMCTAMIKAFTLALCGLSLWLLISMEVSKFDPHHEYLSSVSLRLQMVYSNTWILWFNRQMDLELMFFSIISLHMANWEKWTKFFAVLILRKIRFVRIATYKNMIYITGYANVLLK